MLKPMTLRTKRENKNVELQNAFGLFINLKKTFINITCYM